MGNEVNHEVNHEVNRAEEKEAQKETQKEAKFEVLRKAMIQAMKERDKPKKDAVSSVVEAVKKYVIDHEGDRVNIPDETVDMVILKELKSVKEQIDSCPEERAELKKQYQFRYDLISEFAPKLMSAEEVRIYLQDKFQEQIASGRKGALMKMVMGELKGKADGKVINQVLSELIGK